MWVLITVDGVSVRVSVITSQIEEIMTFIASGNGYVNKP